MRRRVVASWWVLSFGLAGGCGGGEGSGAPAVRDAGVEAGVDRAADAPDGGADGGAAVGVEVFDLRGGERVAAGPSDACGERFRDPGGVAAELGGWARVHVDASAAAGGDGSVERPFAALGDAVGSLGAEPTVVLLAPGRYQGPVAGQGPLALIGSCADGTTLVGVDDAAAFAARDVPRAVVAHVTIEGGRRSVEARRVDHLTVAQARLVDPAESVIDLARVGTAEIRDARLVGGERAGWHVVARRSGVALRRTVIGPGRGPGVVAAGIDDPPGDCAAVDDPVCPYSAFIYLDETLVRGVGGAGLDLDRAALRIRRSRIEGVTGDEAYGARLLQTWAVVTDGTVIRDAGQGLLLSSARGALLDARVAANPRGGVRIKRRAPEERRGFPASPGDQEDVTGERYPRAKWPDPAGWSAAPAVFAGAGWDPPPGWYPAAEALSEGPLPPALRAETPAAERSPEYVLHRWARTQLERVELVDNGGFGVHGSGHAVALVDLEVTGTRGADGAAVALRQADMTPLEREGASTVALSRMEGLRVHDNEGRGVVVSRVALAFLDRSAPGVDPGVVAWAGVGVRLERCLIADQGAFGVVLFDAIAEVRDSEIARNRGVGVWAPGSVARLHGNRIVDTTFGEAPGRDGRVRVADGLVLQGTGTFAELTADAFDLRDNVVTGSERVGVLVVNDRFFFGGRLAVGAGRVADNALDAVVIGALSNEVDGEVRTFEAEGVEFVARDPADVPPPLAEGADRP